MSDQWVTAPEAARMKRVTRVAVYDAIKSGKLRAEKQGGTWLIRRKDVEKWIVRGRGPVKGG